jgi:hypothetical protein
MIPPRTCLCWEDAYGKHVLSVNPQTCAAQSTQVDQPLSPAALSLGLTLPLVDLPVGKSPGNSNKGLCIFSSFPTAVSATGVAVCYKSQKHNFVCVQTVCGAVASRDSFTLPLGRGPKS